MLIFKHSQDITRYISQQRKQGKTIGFAPTMGALHNGHLSLIEEANKKTSVVVCSIFVNPTQFNDKSDYEKYPKATGSDIDLLISAGCDVLFLPDVQDIYPKGQKRERPLDFGFLAETLEGEFRKGHFAGMAQVVEILLRIIKPDILFMGQKDYQQQLIVSRLIQKRNLKVMLKVCKTLREKDGLAMSSRNLRLSPEARKTSVKLSELLLSAKKRFVNRTSTVEEIEKWGMGELLKDKKITPEYFAIRDQKTLEKITSPKQKAVALIAAFIGGIRLIDNMPLN